MTPQFWQQRVREELDGPRYVEAIAGGRRLRQAAFGPDPSANHRDGNYGTGAYLNERLCGIPEGWVR